MTAMPKNLSGHGLALLLAVTLMLFPGRAASEENDDDLGFIPDH